VRVNAVAWFHTEARGSRGGNEPGRTVLDGSHAKTPRRQGRGFRTLFLGVFASWREVRSGTCERGCGAVAERGLHGTGLTGGGLRKKEGAGLASVTGREGMLCRPPSVF